MENKNRPFRKRIVTIIKLSCQRLASPHHNNIILHAKLHVQPCKLKCITACVIVLIRRARVLHQNLLQGYNLAVGIGQGSVALPTHRRKSFWLSKYLCNSVLDAVSIRNIRFDVIDWRAVHHICARHTDYSATSGVCDDFKYFHHRQPQRIGSQRASRCKNSHFPIAAQPRRAHKRRPLPPHKLRKLPYQPQMTAILDTTDAVGIAELRLKNYLCDSALRQKRLPRYAELLRKFGADAGDGGDCDCIHNVAKIIKKLPIRKKYLQNPNFNVRFAVA